MALENIPHYALTHNLSDYPGARAKVSKSPYFTFNDNYSIIPENYYPIVQSRNPYTGLLQIPKLAYGDLNLPSRSWEPKFSKINTALDFENKFIKSIPTTYQPFTNNPYYRAMNIGLSGLERGNNIVKMQRALGLNKSNGLDGDIANVTDTAGLALSGIGYLTDRKKPNPYKTMGLAADGGPVRKFGIGGNILGGLAGGLMGIGQGIQNARLDVNPADVASTINQQRLSATGPEYTYDGLMYDYANTPTLRHLSKRDFKNSNALGMIGGALSAAGVGYNTGENLSKTFDSMLAKRNSQENTAACGGRLNNKYWLGGLISAGVGGISSLIGSLFGNSKAKRAADEANARIDDVNDWNNRTLDMRLNNINSNRFDLMERSYMTPALEGFGNYAFGGHLFSGGGPKNPKSAYGADWSNGVSVFNTGGTHEQNPNEGVQVGVDPQGTPNLVEEGEVEYNDYVYSNRIEVPEEVCQMLGIKPKAKKGKKKSAGSGYTYADIAKIIQKESEERPNDPISKRGLEAAMSYLAQAQEQQKAMQEQQDQAILDDVLMAQAMKEQPSMEGAYGASGMQEMPSEVAPQDMMGMMPNVTALGGRLFQDGGDTYSYDPSDPVEEGLRDRVRDTQIALMSKDKEINRNVASKIGKIGAYTGNPIPGLLGGLAGILGRSGYQMVTGNYLGASKEQKAYEQARREYHNYKKSKSNKKAYGGNLLDGSKSSFSQSPTTTQSPSIFRGLFGNIPTFGESFANFLNRNGVYNFSPYTQSFISDNTSADNTNILTPEENTGSYSFYHSSMPNETGTTITEPVNDNSTIQSGVSQGNTAQGNTSQGTIAMKEPGFRWSNYPYLVQNNMLTPRGQFAYDKYDWKVKPEDYLGEWLTDKELEEYEKAKDKKAWLFKNRPEILAAGLVSADKDIFKEYGLDFDQTNPYLSGLTNVDLDAAAAKLGIDIEKPEWSKASKLEQQLQVLQKAKETLGETNISRLWDTQGNFRTNLGMPYDVKQAKLDALREEEKENRQKLMRDVSLRYAPAAALGAIVGSDLFGLTNKPDTTTANMYMQAASNQPTINAPAIGNYYRYTPTDIETGLNQLFANTGASRGYMADNAGGNRAAAMAGLAALDNAANNTIGDYRIKAKQADGAARLAAAQFNNGIDTQNANWAYQANVANAQANAQRLQELGKGLALRQAAYDTSSAARSANMSAFINSLGAIGKENAYANMVNSNPALTYGTLPNSQSVYLVNPGSLYEDSHTAAYGGKINKKKRKNG